MREGQHILHVSMVLIALDSTSHIGYILLTFEGL